MTDYYQVCLIMFVWFVTVPMVMYAVFAYFKDASRYLLIPMVVASLVFVLVCTILSMIVIGFTMWNGNSLLMRITTGVNVFLLCWTVLMNEIYRWKYSKKDLLRTDQEENDH